MSKPRPDWAIAIRKRRAELGKSQEILADETRTSQGWVSQVERGTQNPTGSTAARFFALLEALRWTPLEFQQATGLQLPESLQASSTVRYTEGPIFGRRSIPVWDLVSAGNGAEGGSAVSYVDIPDNWAGTYAAYVVDGDSMAPRIPSGATIIVKRQDYASPRNIVVCWTESHGMIVKYLDRIEGGTYVFTSFNTDYPPIWTREAVIYGVVREVRMPIDIINGNH